MKGQKWDLSVSTCGSRVQVALLWWTAGSPLSRWTRKGASSGLSKGPHSAQLHFQAFGEQIKQALTEAIDNDELTECFTLGKVSVIHQLLILSWHYTWCWGKQKWTQQNFPLPENLKSSSKRQNNGQMHKEVDKHGDTSFSLGTVEAKALPRRQYLSWVPKAEWK